MKKHLRPSTLPVATPSTAKCVDLAQFGDRFKVEYEESYAAQYGKCSRVDDPWLKIIPCRTGHIYPWGGSRLAASTTAPTGTKLLTLPTAELWQDASDGRTVLFDVSDFEAVVEIMKPRVRRHVSEEQKVAARERMNKMWADKQPSMATAIA